MAPAQGNGACLVYSVICQHLPPWQGLATHGAQKEAVADGSHDPQTKTQRHLVRDHPTEPQADSCTNCPRGKLKGLGAHQLLLPGTGGGTLMQVQSGFAAFLPSVISSLGSCFCFLCHFYITHLSLRPEPGGHWRFLFLFSLLTDAKLSHPPPRSLASFLPFIQSINKPVHFPFTEMTACA